MRQHEINERRAGFEQARRERVDREYRELRAADPDLFRQCVESAEGVMLNRDRQLAVLSDRDRSELGAAIEQALVYIATRASRG